MKLGNITLWGVKVRMYADIELVTDGRNFTRNELPRIMDQYGLACRICLLDPILSAEQCLHHQWAETVEGQSFPNIANEQE